MKIKICGLTNVDDARAAVNAGADMAGVIFAPSPRRVTLTQAQEIAKVVRPHAKLVGVFVNEDTEVIRSFIKECPLGIVQLHGDEDQDFCHAIKQDVPVIKVIRVRDKTDIEQIPHYQDVAILLDTYQSDARGGTGKTFNWDIALHAKDHGLSIILSGGLTPENIAEAVKYVKPHGIDASSSLERAPGLKDHKKVQQFITNARNAES